MSQPAPDRNVSVVLRRRAVDARPRRILLLHGMASSATSWESVLPLCPGDVEVWSAQLPWRVDGTPEWGYDPEPVRWVAEALESVPGEVDLVVAHSFSAVLLLELLSRSATAGEDFAGAYGVRGAVLVSPFFRRRPEQFRWDWMGTLLDRFDLAMRDGIRATTKRRIDDDVLADMSRVVCERVGPYGWMRFLDAYLRTPWLRPDLVSLPCLAVAGANDATAPPVEADVLAEVLPNARASRLPGCGHFPMLEQPSAFVTEVFGFLDTITLPAGTASSAAES